MNIVNKLDKMGVCAEFRNWAEDNKIDSVQNLLNTCPNGYWLERMLHDTGYDISSLEPAWVVFDEAIDMARTAHNNTAVDTDYYATSVEAAQKTYADAIRKIVSTEELQSLLEKI